MEPWYKGVMKQLDVEVSTPANDSLTWEMNYFLVWSLVKPQTDEQTQSNAYEPNVLKVVSWLM